MNISQYQYHAEWSSVDGEYVGLCAEFPSLSFLAKSQEAALSGIHILVADVVTDLHVHNEALPTPKY